MGKSASVGFPPFLDMSLSSPPQSNVSLGANPYWPSLTPEGGGGQNPPIWVKRKMLRFPPFLDMLLSSPPRSIVSMGANPYLPSLTPGGGGGPKPPHLGETKNAPISTIFGYVTLLTTPINCFNGR